VQSMLYPLKFTPIFKNYIWGGRNLERLGKKLPRHGVVAESWEIADHDDDVSRVANGPLTGWSLRELIGSYGEDICPSTENGRFPILIKYIDANRKLSVQVHPDDAYAKSHESAKELGKNECWFVMDAPPGGELVLGVAPGMTRERFAGLVMENRVEEGIRRQPVSPGDFIFIRSGTVHALLDGIVVCEIQQNSDTTYRLYDWGRVGSDGKPRPLHVEKGLDVINFVSGDAYDEYMNGLVIPYERDETNSVQSLVRSGFFNIDLIRADRSIEVRFADEHFNALNVLEGEGTMHWEEGRFRLERGESVLVPRSIGRYRIDTDSMKVLKTFL
jgi:mannose-6-phosphate isomerase